MMMFRGFLTNSSADFRVPLFTVNGAEFAETVMVVPVTEVTVIVLPPLVLMYAMFSLARTEPKATVEPTVTPVVDATVKV